MGARATRITREDLLTPPEFRHLPPDARLAGRVGGARIELVREGSETRLGSSYQQVPVRFMPPHQLDGEPAALLYMINLTAGVLDGDGHHVELDARRDARAVVTGQSATRVHTATTGFATQQWDVNVEDGACLVVLPGPTIPFRGARYYQRTRVELAPNARLLWGDVWLAGRYARGAESERFVFDRIVQDFEARRGGRLVYRDRFRWDGPWSDDDAGWHLGGALATASLFAAGPAFEDLPPAAEGLDRATFRLDNGEACVRWCGPPGAVTTGLVQAALGIAAEWTDGPGSPPWLLGSSGLAPNHWFSNPASGGLRT